MNEEVSTMFYKLLDYTYSQSVQSENQVNFSFGFDFVPLGGPFGFWFFVFFKTMVHCKPGVLASC